VNDAEGLGGTPAARDDTPVGGVPIVPLPPRWPRRVRRTLVVLLLASAGYFAATLYQVHATGRRDEARVVEAIVVMGAAQYDGRPSPQLKARLDHVLDLWAYGVAKWVVVTGGKQPGDRFTEAEASSAYLREHGVPPSAILAESTSHNTYDSLVGVQALMASRGLREVLIVSDPFHLLRCRLIAEEVGLVAYTSPTPYTVVTGGTAVKKEIEEAAGVAAGRIIGFRRLLAITG